MTAFSTAMYDDAVLLLLLSYHRRRRMISEALTLRVKGGRVSHSWCMGVVSHGYGRLCGAGIEAVDGMQAREKTRGLVACREIPEHFPSAR